MRKIAIAFNIVNLLFITMMLLKVTLKPSGLALFILVSVTSLISIYTLHHHKSHSTSFLGLLIQRKKLEEQHKIEKMNSTKNSTKSTP